MRGVFLGGRKARAWRWERRCSWPVARVRRFSQASPTKAGLTSIDGATVSLASFENSAFPYHGIIPNYQETGKTRPFLDVDDNGRLGHSSPRGGIHWEDQTYSDRSVLLAAPQSFDPNKPGVIIVFFHGNNATLSRDVIARQQIVSQLADSGLNAFWSRRSSRWMRRIRAPGDSGRRAASPRFSARRSRSSATFIPTRAAPLGGCRSSSSPIAAAICPPPIRSPSAATGRVRGLVLLDALYGEREKFVSWAEGPGRSAFFVSAYSTSSREGNDAVRSRARGRRRANRERSAGCAYPRRRRLRRRRLRRSQRLRHVRWGGALTRHLLPDWRVAPLVLARQDGS